MDIRIPLALGLSLAAAAAPAQEPPPLPAIEVSGYVADCSHPTLPTQRQVGEWTGLQNFGAVYDAREQLMADIATACRRPGVANVHVVFENNDGRDADRIPWRTIQTRAAPPP